MTERRVPSCTRSTCEPCFQPTDLPRSWTLSTCSSRRASQSTTSLVFLSLVIPTYVSIFFSRIPRRNIPHQTLRLRSPSLRRIRQPPNAPQCRCACCAPGTERLEKASASLQDRQLLVERFQHTAMSAPGDGSAAATLALTSGDGAKDLTSQVVTVRRLLWLALRRAKFPGIFSVFPYGF